MLKRVFVLEEAEHKAEAMYASLQKLHEEQVDEAAAKQNPVVDALTSHDDGGR